MFLRIPKRFVLVSIVGLLIIAATVLVASQWLYTPQPPLIPAPTSAELYQEELAVAQRTCDKVNRMIGGGSVGGPLTAEECIEPNRSCVKRRGPHAVWAGAADGDNVIICSCADGYEWLNTDGTKWTSYSTGVTLTVISAPGECVARQ